MPRDSLDRLIALAGIYQAVSCVIQIAKHGTASSDAMEPCLHSLLQIDADNVDQVFGKPGAVASGARQIIASLTGIPERHLDITRYVVLLMRLERTLSRRPDLLSRIRSGIEAASVKHEHFALLHPNLLAHFADLYSETLSQLEPRIIIRGESLHLLNPDNQHRIRALLLAGVRAAMLWRQVGGSRWQILFRNKQILIDAQRYLSANESLSRDQATD